LISRAKARPLQNLLDVPIPAAPYVLALARRSPGHGLADCPAASLEAAKKLTQAFDSTVFGFSSQGD